MTERYHDKLRAAHGANRGVSHNFTGRLIPPCIKLLGRPPLYLSVNVYKALPH